MRFKTILFLILFSAISAYSYSQGEPPKNYSGEWITKYSNGQVNFKGKYANGLPIGEGVYYFRNGKIKYNGSYLEGKKDGIWTTYLESGSIRYKVMFEKGDQIGERIYY